MNSGKDIKTLHNIVQPSAWQNIVRASGAPSMEIDTRTENANKPAEG